MIKEGIISVEIGKELRISRPLVSYYVRKAKKLGFIKETSTSGRNRFELTQPGNNFLERYERPNYSLPICRAENIRFKALVIKMPDIPVNWKKIQMTNWVLYAGEIDSVKIKLNMGNKPTIEFLPSPIEGDNPFRLYATLLYECSKVAHTLDDRIGLEVGRLEQSSRGEWLTYDPIAGSFCKLHGQVTYEGIGKVNASKPREIGEFEFHDPRALHDYLLMPRRLKTVEDKVDEVLKLLNEKTQADDVTHG
jgi:DNA-binding Lrp family transcriptional regulator